MIRAGSDSEDGPLTGERSPKDGPWFWVTKAALARVRDHFGNGCAYAIAVYACMTEAASNEGAATFALSVSQIASRCGAGTRKTRQILHELANIGLIEIEFRKEAGEWLASRYAVLPVRIHAGNLRRKSAPSAGIPLLPDRTKGLGW
jgi:hypothetical protein